MKVWFQLISELCVNLSAGIIGLTLIEQQLKGIPAVLTFKIIVAILSLVVAKYLRDESNKL